MSESAPSVLSRAVTATALMSTTAQLLEPLDVGDILRPARGELVLGGPGAPWIARAPPPQSAYSIAAASRAASRLSSSAKKSTCAGEYTAEAAPAFPPAAC